MGSRVSANSNFLWLCDLEILFWSPVGRPQGLRKTRQPATSRTDLLISIQKSRGTRSSGDTVTGAPTMGRHGHAAVSGRGALRPSGSPAPRLLSPAVRDAASWDKFQLVTLRTGFLGRLRLLPRVMGGEGRDVRKFSHQEMLKRYGCIDPSGETSPRQAHGSGARNQRALGVRKTRSEFWLCLYRLFDLGRVTDLSKSCLPHCQNTQSLGR